MKIASRLVLTFVLFAASASAPRAQAIIWEACQTSSDGSAYGRAVALADLDGDGDAEIVVGAPGNPFLSGWPGRVYFHSTFLFAEGDDPFDRFGAAVASLDIDGDGRSDVVVGAPGDDDHGAQSGSVRALDADRNALFTLHGAGAGDELGTSVARVGDVDGDGHEDFLAGAPQSTTGAAGYAWLVSGGSGNVLRVHVGEAAGDRFGQGLAGIGDIDLDGIPDYAVGAPGESGRGRVRVFSGADGSVVRTHDGALPGDEFGYALGGGTDVDRDTVSELVIGAPRGGSSAGSVAVFSGATGALLWTVTDSDAGARFGAAVAGAGDFDGDGHGDVVVGAPGQTSAVFADNEGSASVLSGVDGALLLRAGGGWSGAGAGVSVAGGADVDGDELADVVVGGLFDNDGYGAAACVSAYGRSGAVLHAFDGAPGEALGASVALLPDIDGDGLDDFAFGVPERFTGSPLFTLGVVEVRSGASGGLIGTYSDFDLRMGTAIAPIGDVDGDGRGDLAIASWDPQSLWSFGSVHAVSTATFTPLWTAAGQVSYPGLSFGYALAATGDHDGDGIDDVLVGTPGTNTAAARAIGSAEVRSGANGLLLATLGGYSDWDYFGYSLTSLGDANGDGEPDYAVGAPTERSNASFVEPGQNRVAIVLSNPLRSYNHGPLAQNSTGAAARIEAAGSSSLAVGDVAFRATGLPPQKAGVFLIGSTPITAPYGSGWLCVGGQTGRVSSVLATGSGEVEHALDFAAPPASFVPAGTSWSFQFVHRDVQGAVNATDAVRIEFLP